MGRKARITPWQFAMLYVGFLIGSSTLVVPTGPAGRDGWISTLLGGAAGLVEMVVLMAISARHPGKLPAEVFVACGGKILGTLLTILYTWFCFHLGALVIKNVTEAYFATVFTATPPAIVTATMALLCVVAVWLGIETVARSSEVFVPLLVFGVVGITALTFATSGLIVPNNVLPMFERGPLPVLKTAWSNFAFPFGESVVLLSVIPYVSGTKRLRPHALGSIVIVTLVLTIIEFRNIAVLGPEAASVLFPSLDVVGMISVGKFIQRLDAVLLFYWTFGTFFKTALCLFAVVVNAGALFGMEDPRLLTFPLAALMAALSSYVERNAVDMADFASYAWPPYSLPFEVLLPLLVLFLSLRSKRRE